MPLTLYTAPATEPLTVAEVRTHLRVDGTNAEPAPTALTATLSVVAGALSVGAYRYVVTFVTADGETEAGAVSASVSVVNAGVAGKIALTAIPVGGSAVTSRKVYRTVANGSTYLLVTTIADNTTTTYTDNVADASLGVQAPTANTTADPELVSWIAAARQFVETYVHRALISQTWDLKFDSFPGDEEAIVLPKAPLISVTSVTYVATDGTSTTWSSSNYTVDAPSGPWAGPGRITPAYGVTWPSTRDQVNAVVVRFVAGYGAASSVPAPIKSAMLLLIGQWYRQREAGMAGGQSALPFGVEALLWPYKVF